MAQNVNKVDDIPCNNYIDIKIDDSELEQYKAAYPDLDIIDGKIRIYNPIQGVPITFLDKYNPDQFEIVGRADANIKDDTPFCYITGYKDKGGAPLVNNKFVYKRILIRKRVKV